MVCSIKRQTRAKSGYDAGHIKIYAQNKDMIPIIPIRSNRKRSNKEFDKYLYQLRHLVENAFARLKHFRAIATRFDKLARNYQSIIYIACINLTDAIIIKYVNLIISINGNS